MTDISQAEPLYQRVGREPMEDAELEAALSAWRADNPGADDRGAVQRMRRLNAEAIVRTKASAAGTTVEALHRVRAERHAREAAARLAHDLDNARRLDVPTTPDAPTAIERGFPSLAQIEAERFKLAAAGRPHGYDALGGNGHGHPFPGQRSTIRNRYKGMAPPGTWIVGVCDKAPAHQHYGNNGTLHPLT